MVMRQVNWACDKARQGEASRGPVSCLPVPCAVRRLGNSTCSRYSRMACNNWGRLPRLPATYQ